MTCCKRTKSDDVNVIIHRILCCFFWSLEQRSDIHVKAHIREGCSNNFGTAVMTVLAHLSNHDTRATTFEFFKVICHLTYFFDYIVIFIFAGVYTGNRADNRFMTATNFFNSKGNFTQGCTSTSCFKCKGKQVAFPGFCSICNRFETGLNLIFVTVSTQLFETTDLRFPYSCVIYVEDI